MLDGNLFLVSFCLCRESSHALCPMGYLGCWVLCVLCLHFSCPRPSTSPCLTACPTTCPTTSPPWVGFHAARHGRSTMWPKTANCRTQPTQDFQRKMTSMGPTQNCPVSLVTQMLDSSCKSCVDIIRRMKLVCAIKQPNFFWNVRSQMLCFCLHNLYYHSTSVYLPL